MLLACDVLSERLLSVHVGRPDIFRHLLQRGEGHVGVLLHEAVHLGLEGGQRLVGPPVLKKKLVVSVLIYCNCWLGFGVAVLLSLLVLLFFFLLLLLLLFFSCCCCLVVVAVLLLLLSCCCCLVDVAVLLLLCCCFFVDVVVLAFYCCTFMFPSLSNRAPLLSNPCVISWPMMAPMEPRLRAGRRRRWNIG